MKNLNQARAFSSALHDKMEEVIGARQTEVKAFMAEHKNTKIGDVTVGQVVGGMRGLPGMLYETSKLHHIDGIEYRGRDLFDIRENAPKTVEGG